VDSPRLVEQVLSEETVCLGLDRRAIYLYIATYKAVFQAGREVRYPAVSEVPEPFGK